MNNQPPYRSSSNSPSGSTQSSNPSEASNRVPSQDSQGVRAKAGDTVAKLTDAAQQAGSQAKDAAASLVSEANQKATGFLNQQVTAGADLADHVAESVRHAADNLGQNAPQLASLVRGAAEKVEEFSRDMRGQTVGDLVRTASDFTRRQPAVVFGLASLAGFVLFRVLKSSSPSSSDVGHRSAHPDHRYGEASRQFHGS